MNTQLARSLPERVSITDVSARDGLQSVAGAVAPELRAAWVKALLSAGVDEVEAASFVSPALLPQMAGAAEVLRNLDRESLKRSWVLVPNRRGVEDALAAGALNLLFVASATETHSRANLGRPVAKVLSDIETSLPAAFSAGARVRAALSVAFVDDAEGVVPPSTAAAICGRLASMGFPELTLCDTHGGATPPGVLALLKAVRGDYPGDRLGLHLHDTFGFAAANVFAGLLGGIRRYDGSVGGLGGCPFLPGAKGNMDTENLIRFLDGLGVRHNADPVKLSGAALYCDSLLNGRNKDE